LGVERPVHTVAKTLELVGALAAALVQVVPLEVNTLPLVLGATKVGADVPFPKMTLLAVRVARLVPPLATASVPANVIVPEVVIGPPEVVKPVVPPDTATLETVAAEPALLASSLTVPALFLKYSFSSTVLSANSPATRLPEVGIAAAVVLWYSDMGVKFVCAMSAS